MKEDKIIQASGFALSPDKYIVIAVTESGKVLASEGDGLWADIGPKYHRDEGRGTNRTTP